MWGAEVTAGEGEASIVASGLAPVMVMTSSNAAVPVDRRSDALTTLFAL